jgi:glycerophosphoryl diester phosphodiesterase
VIIVKESAMDASVVADARAAGKAIWVWTVRTANIATRQIKFGVAGIIAEPVSVVQQSFFKLSGGAKS